MESRYGGIRQRSFPALLYRHRWGHKATDYWGGRHTACFLSVFRGSIPHCLLSTLGMKKFISVLMTVVSSLFYLAFYSLQRPSRVFYD